MTTATKTLEEYRAEMMYSRQRMIRELGISINTWKKYAEGSEEPPAWMVLAVTALYHNLGPVPKRP